STDFTCTFSCVDLHRVHDPDSLARQVSSQLLALRCTKSQTIPIEWLARRGSIPAPAPPGPLHRMPRAILHPAFPGTYALEEEAPQAFTGASTGAFASNASSNPKSGLGKPLLRRYQRCVSFKPVTKSVGLNFKTR